VNVFPRAMWRYLVPYLLIAQALVIAAGVAYEHGAPAWVVHFSVLVGVLVVLPGYLRWEDRHQ
jgi:hypothetical protein